MDGATLREHLESVQRQTGVAPAKLAEAPPCPAGLKPLWSDFRQLHRIRGSNGVSPSPITHSQILDFERVRGFPFQSFEKDCIRAADAAYFEHRAERK